MLKELLKSCVKKGKFTLASGEESDFYIDLRPLTLNPWALTMISRRILGIIQDTDSMFGKMYPYAAVGGPELGAVPIAVAVALESINTSHPMRAFVVRKEAKDHGRKKLVEGLDDLDKKNLVVMVEDVITTGETTLRAVNAVKEMGFGVGQIITVVDRGGAARLRMGEGLSVQWLYTAEELMS